MRLYNKVDRKILMERLQNESFRRKTISFYRYVIIDLPNEERKKLRISYQQKYADSQIYKSRLRPKLKIEA